MKLSSLLAQREALLRQALLANLAFVHDRLSDFARRVTRARLSGEVRLQQAAPSTERFWASLTALHGRQSVIEEHFSDDDLMDLADMIAYATGGSEIDLTFRIEELAERFVAPLHDQLAKAGVTIDHEERPVDPDGPENSSGCAHADENT